MGFVVSALGIWNWSFLRHYGLGIRHSSKMPYYETDRALAEYLLLHFGTPEHVLPYQFGPSCALDFPVRCVTESVAPARLPRQARALDLGCAVGRSAFELTRLCAQVLRLGYSTRLI